MDWSPRETFLYPNGIDDFECDVEADLPMTVMQKFDPKPDDDSQVESFSSSEPEFWRKFKSSPLFRYNAFNPRSKLPSGLCIFFCPRATSVFDDIPSDLSDLCIPRAEWELITKKFCLNKLLVRVIRQKITSISVETRHLSMDDEYGSTGDTLLMCTATASSPGSSEGDTFAISSTHFKDANLTVAVVLGATPEKLSRIRDLIENAPEAIGHPLLMLGLVAELMLGLFTELVDKTRNQSIRTIRMVPEIWHQVGTSRLVTNYILELESLRSECLWLDEAVKIAKYNLDKALAVYDQEKRTINDGHSDIVGSRRRPNPGSDEFETILKQYAEHKTKERFQDILTELDALIALTRISREEMSSMSTVIMGELTRRDTADSAQSAKTGSLIAFLAMLYLPITSVATIFATPVFNFGNDWRDWRYQPTSSTRISPDGDAGPQPVLSGYFWIYLGVSIALTSLTMEGWWRVARRMPQDNSGTGKSMSTLPHWTLYPVWPLFARYYSRKRGDAGSESGGKGDVEEHDSLFGGEREKSPSRSSVPALARAGTGSAFAGGTAAFWGNDGVGSGAAQRSLLRFASLQRKRAGDDVGEMV